MQAPGYHVMQADNTTTLLIDDPEPSDAGVYQCVANDRVYGWTLRRIITLGKMQLPCNGDFGGIKLG